MKNLTIAAACLVLTMTLASTGFAQQGRPGRPAANAPRSTAGQNNRQDPSDALMRRAAKEIEKAHDLLGRALPIYHGHRVSAMQDCRDAEKEIAQGLRFDRRNDNTAAGAKVNDGESADKYSKEQVQRSNALLKKAGEILVHAKGELQKGANEYGGHRAAAIKEVDSAIAQIKLALDSLTIKP